MMNWFN